MSKILELKIKLLETDNKMKDDLITDLLLKIRKLEESKEVYKQRCLNSSREFQAKYYKNNIKKKDYNF